MLLLERRAKRDGLYERDYGAHFDREHSEFMLAAVIEHFNQFGEVHIPQGKSGVTVQFRGQPADVGLWLKTQLKKRTKFYLIDVLNRVGVDWTRVQAFYKR
jgi:hypothetical protein